MIASNKLPASEAQGRDNTFYQDVWTPLTTRVKFVYTSDKHKSSEVFPYTTGQLAKAIHFLVEHIHLLKAMEDLDSVEVPGYEEAQLLAWNKDEAHK